MARGIKGEPSTIYVDTFPGCRKVEIDWGKGTKTVIHDLNLLDPSTMSGYANAPPGQPSWWKDAIVIDDDTPSLNWDDILEIQKRAIAMSFGVPYELFQKEGGNDMKVYFGCVIYNDGENDPEIVVNGEIVLAKTTCSAHKKFFAKAVVAAPDVAPENLVVYSTELTPTGGT